MVLTFSTESFRLRVIVLATAAPKAPALPRMVKAASGA
jgi:hypothetical protein